MISMIHSSISTAARRPVVKKRYDLSAEFLLLILMLDGHFCISYDVLEELTAVWLQINEKCNSDLEQYIVSSFFCSLLCKRNE